MQLKLKNVSLKPGDQLKVKGQILHDADRFAINLGWSTDELALHFNPRFDEVDGEGRAVLVCNSRRGGCWETEERQHNPLHRGSEVKIVVKIAGGAFTVELPGGEEVHFPNRCNRDNISFVTICGAFRLKSFQIC